MEYIEIEPDLLITSSFFLWYRKKRIAILSDMHIGYDHSLVEDGVSLPGSQKKLIYERLSSMINRYDPKELIVIGDFKHTFSGDQKQEMWDIYETLDYIIERTNLSIVRGNHDNYLKTAADRKGVPFYDRTLRIDDLTLTHGHKETDHTGLLVIGHEHPSVRIRDETGGLIHLPCFLYHPAHRVLVLPAYNPLFACRNMLSGDGFASPLLSKHSVDEYRVYPVTDDGLMDFRTIREIKAAIPSVV